MCYCSRLQLKCGFLFKWPFDLKKVQFCFHRKKNSSFNKVFVFMQTVTNCNFLAELLKSNNNFRHKEIFPWLIKFLCWKNEMFRVFLWSMKKKYVLQKKNPLSYLSDDAIFKWCSFFSNLLPLKTAVLLALIIADVIGF